MGMVGFHFLFPEVAERETRSITTFNSDELPEDTYVFAELYCVDHGCDCRRVMVNVFSMHGKQHLATINHAFEPPDPDGIHAEDGQTFLDPLNPQSDYSDALLELFEDAVLTVQYQRRLERHYEMVKAALEDPNHRMHEVLKETRLPSSRERTRRRQSPKVGRNEPCVCGSGRKFKKCCGATVQLLQQTTKSGRC